MDSFDFSDLAAVNDQSFLFGSYQQPTGPKRQQPYPSSFVTPVYTSVEDWSAAELTSDSAPSPTNASPVSPLFSTFGFPASGDDWASWDTIEQSPESDLFFFKSEPSDKPDLASIPAMNASQTEIPAEVEDVVFGREGVNDTRPLFATPQLSADTPAQPPPQQSQAQPHADQGRRYPARDNTLKRKSSDAAAASLTTPSSPRSSSSSSSSSSSCSPPPRQRRHTAGASAMEGPKQQPPPPPHLGPKKTAHNMIEKRYRTNLNDKIAALRDSVPALRVMVHRLEHAEQQGLDVMDEIKAEAGVDGDDDLAGLTPAHKLNKATILSKATEYIANLERRNAALAKENAALRNRVDGFEMLVMSRNVHRNMWN